MEISEIIECTKKINLLYVEDNIEARTFTLELLQRFFNNISVAKDGEEGLTLFKENDFDLVITDINMPKKDGIALIKDIKKLNKKVDFIVLSAHNESGYFEEIETLNVMGYINKPMVLKEFIELMEIFYNKNYLNNTQIS